MQIIKAVSLILLLGLFSSEMVWARGGGGHGGGHGGGFGGGGHWGGHGHGGNWGGHGGHWGGHHGFYGYPYFGYGGLGLGYGLGFGYGGYYGGYPSYQTTIVAPPVYIERQASPQPQTNYWYYCSKPQGYYPYINTCSVNWIPVPPRPN